MIRYQPSEQAEGLQPDSSVQDQDRRKNRRIGGIEKRKRERRGKRSIKSPVPSLVKALWPAIHVRRRPGTKWPQLWPLGLVHQWVSWSPSTPSGQDVSCSEEEIPPESPLVAGRETSSRI